MFFVQYEFSFDEDTTFRDELINRAKEEARITITKKSKYMSPNRFIPRDEKIGYMRSVLEEEYQESSSKYGDKQVFAIYGSLQEQKIKELVASQLPLIEQRANDISELTKPFFSGEKTLTEILNEKFEKKE